MHRAVDTGVLLLFFSVGAKGTPTPTFKGVQSIAVVLLLLSLLRLLLLLLQLIIVINWFHFRFFYWSPDVLGYGG